MAIGVQLLRTNAWLVLLGIVSCMVIGLEQLMSTNIWLVRSDYVRN